MQCERLDSKVYEYRDTREGEIEREKEEREQISTMTVPLVAGSKRSVRESGWLRFLAGLSSDRISCLIVACVALLLLCVLGGQRIASYKVNTTDVVKLPLNDIERECPAPNYPVLGTSGDKPKICITTLTDAAKADALQRLVRWRNFNSLLDMTWPNKQNYCKKHGYHLFDESMTLDTSRPPSWSKIKAAQRLLKEENCDWVFWMDADTVIMNSEKRLEDFLPRADSGIDLVLTRQKGPSWNAGAWLIRNTPWSLEFLDTWWNKKDFVKKKGLSVSGDNDALRDFLRSMEKDYFDAHIVVPARCLFNSVAKFATKEEAAAFTPENIKKYQYYMHLERYHKGDLVAHIAGVDNKISTSEILLKDAV